MAMEAATLLPSRGEFVIHGAYAVTMEPSVGDIERSVIHVRDGEIISVGPAVEARKAGDIDGSGFIAVPGFIDTHWHLWSCALRGIHSYIDPDFGYFPLTMRLGPLYTPLDSYRNVRLGVAEALLSGITTINNWAHNVLSPDHADAEVQALSDTGIRGRFSYGWGQNLAVDTPMNSADVKRIKNERFSSNDLLSLGVAIRTPVAYQRGNVSLDILRSDWTKAQELGLPLTIHNRAGVVSILEEQHLLDSNVLIVHPQAFTSREIEILAQRQVNISSSPVNENARGPNGARGPIQLSELLQAGVGFSISVDEVVTNGKADFFSVMRELVRSDWQRRGEHTKLTARRMLELSTIDGARAMGLAHLVGSLKPGKRADITLIRSTDINLSPIIGDPSDMLVFSGQPNNVDTVIVDGRVLVRDGRLTSLDPEQVVSDAMQTVRDLRGRDPRQS
jgi:5-methylthioadenosine/S-adenosylhomocysteine deaminase